MGLGDSYDELQGKIVRVHHKGLGFSVWPVERVALKLYFDTNLEEWIYFRQIFIIEFWAEK